MNTQEYMELAEARLLEIMIPIKTNTYSPVPHRLFIEELSEQLDKSNLSIVKKRYNTALNYQIVSANYIVAYDADPELQLNFNWANSYNKIIKASITGGAYQKICSNGMFGSNTRYIHKHNGNVLEEIHSAIQQAVQSAEKQMQELIYVKNFLRNIEMTKTRSAELLGRLFIEEEIITSTQLNIVKRELESPSYQYDFLGTAFELYSHLTHSFKETTPQNYMKHHVNTHEFFRKLYDI